MIRRDSYKVWSVFNVERDTAAKDGYGSNVKRIERRDESAAYALDHSFFRFYYDKDDEYSKYAEGERLYPGGDFDRALRP